LETLGKKVGKAWETPARKKRGRADTQANTNERKCHEIPWRLVFAGDGHASRRLQRSLLNGGPTDVDCENDRKKDSQAIQVATGFSLGLWERVPGEGLKGWFAGKKDTKLGSFGCGAFS